MKEKLKEIKIGNKIIGKGNPVFIIAEAGINHNGNIGLAKKLIDAAKEARVDAVKFQTFKSEDLVTKNAGMADYQEKNMGKKSSQLAMLKKLELNYKDFRDIKNYCDKKEIIFLSTPHTSDAVDFLKDLVPAYKIASGDLVNFPFLEYIARKAKPMIISTGMSQLEEVAEATNIVRKNGNKDLVVMHCTTNYPCLVEEVNLKAMLTLKDRLGILVGYSDHTLGIEVPIMATALGACVIEKHFTLDKKMEGPDHKASLEPHELKEMVRSIRCTEKALGSGTKEPTQSEIQIARLIRKSIVAYKDIKKDAIITKDMLIIKRPGTGIHSKHLDRIMGKKTKKDIKKDDIIDFKQLY